MGSAALYTETLWAPLGVGEWGEEQKKEFWWVSERKKENSESKDATHKLSVA